MEKQRTNAERFHEVERLFEAVCDSPREAWEARLLELAPEDASLRAEALELLKIEAAEPLQIAGAGPGALATLIADEATEAIEVPGFRVTRELGAGGMAVVFEAEQLHPRRSVALKVLRSGLSTPELVRRFEFEADALGRLQHPGIASIYEAGVVGTVNHPRPYFAMELVQGLPLDRWAEQERPSVRERLALFARVCDAVQHAHARGVIHRDLKPSNILVVTDGSERHGRPKVLDFGVARATDHGVPGFADATQHGQLVGTLAYMSPEQLAGEHDAVDIRSDVYGLGVVLYELLTGALPCDVGGMSVFAAVQKLSAFKPVRVGSLDAELRGDVEVIVMTAMDPDKHKRYQTAAALADDIRRHLDNRTISARPHSALDQLSRFARRNRLAVAGGSLIVLSLCLGVLGLGLGLRSARIEAKKAEAGRVEAERQAAISQAVTDFFNNDVLAAIVPSAEGREVTVAEALDEAARSLPERFAKEPATGAAIRNNIGNVYHAIGRFAEGEPLIRRAAESFEAQLGPGHELTLAAWTDLGKILRDQGKFEEAKEVFDRASLHAEAGPGRSSRAALELLVLRAGLAAKAFGDTASAGALLDEFDKRRAALPDRDSLAIFGMQVRGDLAFEFGDAAEAERLYRKVLAEKRATFGEEHPATLVSLHNVAAALEKLGRREEAEPMYRKVLEIERERSGPDHPDILVTAHNLAFLCAKLGRYSEAEPLYIDTLMRCKRVYGPAHPGTLRCTVNLAALYRETGRAELAADILECALDDALEEMPWDAPAAADVMSALATTLVGLHENERAEPLLARSVEAMRASLPAGHARLGAALSDWGACLIAMDRAPEAEVPLVEAYEILSERGEAGEARAAADRLSTVYEAMGRERDGEMWGRMATGGEGE
ncbi:MAG: serine/threonine protein kinase [Phycisphaeraceae bacterium]|nr:serine/threonine protein kinase [Phycisphaeraceae bacterium]